MANNASLCRDAAFLRQFGKFRARQCFLAIAIGDLGGGAFGLIGLQDLRDLRRRFFQLSVFFLLDVFDLDDLQTARRFDRVADVAFAEAKD